MTNIRPPAVAGMFYPSSATELTQQMSEYLNVVTQTKPEPIKKPKALIVPHAGYIYSGLTAAFAYYHLHQHQFTRVVILGPTHCVPVLGLALPSSNTFSTPLGEIALDMDGIAKASALPQVISNGATHAQEHSLEVQLPFLQHQLKDFKLIPFAVGQTSAKEVAEVLSLFWDDTDTLIIISSDLSHFHSYDQANLIDQLSCEAILRGELLSNHEQACGATPVNGLLTLLQQHTAKIQLLDRRNSGDTAGGKDRVVGYASFACSMSKT